MQTSAGLKMHRCEEWGSLLSFCASALLLFCAAALLAGCPAPRFDPATGVVKNEGASYRVGNPGADWRLIKSGSDVAYFNRETLGTIAANASCAERGDPALRVLLNHLVFGFTDRRVLHEETVQLDGREALRAQVAAKLDGVPRRLYVYIVKKDGCVFDLQYEAPDKAFDAGLPSFAEFVKGFATIR